MIDIQTIIKIFFIGFYEAVLLLGGIVLWKGGLSGNRPTQIQRYFSLMLLYSAVALVIDLMINNVLVYHSIALDYLCVILDCIAMGFCPLQAMVLRQQQPTKRNWCIAFAPVLPIIIFTPFIYDTYPSVLEILAIITFLCMVCRNLWEFHRLKRWDEALKDEYSDVEYKETSWFLPLVLIMLFTMLLLLPVDIDAGLGWREIFFYVIMSFLFIRFTYHALKQENLIAHPLASEVPCSLAEGSEMEVVCEDPLLQPEAITPLSGREGVSLPSWVEKMERLMNEDRIYTDSELNLTELAKAVGTNRTYLSKYLNETLSMTFYDYVNGLRLKEAERILRTTDESMDMIAEECGFKSRSTFYKIFLKTHTMTPTEWRDAEAKQ